MSKKKILITGANGQLGKALRQLEAFYPEWAFVFLSREDLRIHHFELVRNFFRTIQPAFCINCAAYTAVDKAEEEEELAYLVNAESVGVLAAICREHHTKFIHISTDYVFDGNARLPYQTDSPTNPQTIYGASKLQGERQALEYNPDSIIIRTSWVYSEYGKNFVKTMLKLMQEKNEISVVNDQVGSPTYAVDLAATLLTIVKRCDADAVNCPSGVYHFCNEGMISWYDFALAIKAYTGSTCTINPIPSSAFPTAARRPHYSVLDCTSLQVTFGVTLKNWKESLEHCLDKIKNP
ncbi:MAG: dTDP-4-dehydrorhamnose reductase [Terrimonas sp.]|nr:dTDP-4-dehydrorhamnose reductase [Terrimonas sp.]